jgi:MoxR-like ATPase
VTTHDQLATIDDVAEVGNAVLAQVERVIVGKHQPLRLILGGLLADGHVIIEDLPGMAKTLIAQLFAQSLGLDLARVQVTPDLLPSDITGSSVFDPSTRELEFRPGPVFANLLLGDEINRAPPKTQAALLEAMQERQVTVDGTTHALPTPFNVLATQNPIEYEGTYPLPEAQLDRFLLRVRIGYPQHEHEVDILQRRLDRGTDAATVDQVTDASTFGRLQQAVEQVHVSPELIDYVVRLVAATRQHQALETGASPRASLALLKTTRAMAATERRDYTTPDDVKFLAGPVLAHRLIVKPEMWARGVTADAVVQQCLETVPTPRAAEALPEP